MNLNLCDEDIERVIYVLDYYANMEAGFTQSPDLRDPANYYEFNLAREIERRLDRSRALRAQWEN